MGVHRDCRQSSGGGEREGWVGEEDRKWKVSIRGLSYILTTLSGPPSAFLSLPVSSPTS